LCCFGAILAVMFFFESLYLISLKLFFAHYGFPITELLCKFCISATLSSPCTMLDTRLKSDSCSRESKLVPIFKQCAAAYVKLEGLEKCTKVVPFFVTSLSAPVLYFCTRYLTLQCYETITLDTLNLWDLLVKINYHQM